MFHLPEIMTADISTYRYFAMYHQAHFCVWRVGLGTRLVSQGVLLHSWAIVATPNFVPSDLHKRRSFHRGWEAAGVQ